MPLGKYKDTYISKHTYQTDLTAKNILNSQLMLKNYLYKEENFKLRSRNRTKHTHFIISSAQETPFMKAEKNPL